MSHVFHRHLEQHYPTAVGGEGPYLIDAEGRRYLDACGGAAVSCLGHSDAEVIEAIREQVGRLAYAHTSFFTSEPMEALADFLIERAPSGLSSVYFVSGGSEAVEAALKMARQYFLERGEPQRKHLIARRQSYHGNTLGALATGGNTWRRRQFEPMLVEVSHVSPCYAYRDQAPGETPEAYGERLAAELEAEIERLGPETVMAFVAEPVVGATLGAVPAVPGYFKRVREICDRHGILLILDEVMCGMGRTGSLFAAEQEGVVPDLTTIAKGLGGGYQPIGATLVSERIRSAIAEGSGFFQHGHTYIGHATACAAALAVQRAIEQRDLLSRVRQLGEGLQQRLVDRFADHPHVGDIRGRGLFRGLELVAERDGKTPFDPSRKLHAEIKRTAMDEGLMCYPMGGTIDGRSGDHILLAPPFILEPYQLDEIVDKLDISLKRVFERR
ncbi:aspartate aminotransferase family protein [Halomonas elongata]|uniref:Aspartate aminotransferase family protein n=1 Tax=Halomonas elongata (strain ATCC 33173 / DSM 2581 / NBRC 15536 / NCIMB 2198 / 1H9) TaxID=768066 RepID=E1V8W4_HALED|nr:aspartate aminotransferase family protein [Halomonas elongata]WBF18979.1 aspartate aminotransferase family protein [Halomonas elongata]WPU47839.1 aspartate aminotransferase family protein [Halomonas elongata DSM 2581]CBV41739.1 pyridoxal phosphate-dependent aminotransferase [Halomonas elongata DSM 2581]